MSDAGEFGRLLRRLRRERDLTQEALAQAAFCVRDTVKKIEAGQRRPSRQMAAQFADVLALEGAERAQFLAAARIALAPDRLVSPDDVQTPSIVAVPGIPTPTATLIGRAQELATAHALFTQPAIRLLTLTGPGGIGKTRLALQLAHEVGLSFPDGCAFVDLSPLLLPEHVLPAVAQALKIREVGRESLEQRVQAYLAPRRYLLVLDNFEHMLAAAPLVTSLLRAAPALRVMVASRVALRLSGEQEYPVPPLAVPPGEWGDVETSRHGDEERDSAFSTTTRLSPEEIARFPAVQLFIERARAARPEFALTNANALQVVEICRRLDGLPLAIELAAAHIRHFSVFEIARRIRGAEALRVLANGSRDQPARQQTIRETINWSYRLLHPADQQLFRWLGVFTGGWELEIAGILVQYAARLLQLSEASVPQLFDRMPNLVDSSMVVLDGSRYRMLETLRAYAIEQLHSSTEIESLQEAHARTYADITSQVQVQSPSQRLRHQILVHWSNAELGNLRCALRWAIDHQDITVAEPVFRLLWDCLTFRGFYDESRTWRLELAAKRGMTKARPAFRAFLVGTLGWMAALDGTGAEVLEWGHEACAIYKQTNDHVGYAWACRILAQGYVLNDDESAALAYLLESLQVCQSAHDIAGLSFSWLDLGLYYLHAADGERAEHALQEALTLFNMTGDTQGVLQAPARLVQAAILLGDLPLAASRLRKSLVLDGLHEAEGYSNYPIIAATHLAAVGGQWVLAARLLGQLESLTERIGPTLPVNRRSEQQLAALIQSKLDQRLFAEARSAGRLLTYEQAITEALTLAQE